MSSASPPEKNEPPPETMSRAARLSAVALAIGAVAAVIGAGVVLERREQHASDAPSSGPSIAAASAASPAPPSSSPRSPGPDAIAKEAIARACADASDCACRLRATAELLTIAAAGAALSALDGAPRACRSEADAEGLRAEALARTGAPGATDIARRRSLEVPSDGRAAYALARIAFTGGDKEPAKLAAERAIELGRKAPGEVLLGRLALDAGDPQRAREHFDRALAAEPKEVEARYFAGITERRIGRYQKARSLLLGATRENPAFIDARWELAVMAHAIGAMDDARHHYRKLFELLPESDPRMVELGNKLGEKARAGSTYTVGNGVKPSASAR